MDGPPAVTSEVAQSSGWNPPPAVYDVIRNNEPAANHVLQAPLKQLIVGDAPSSMDATTEPPLRRQPARSANALSRMTVRVGDALAS